MFFSLLALSERENIIVHRIYTAAQRAGQFAIFVDEKFVEIPHDLVIAGAIFFCFAEPLVNGVLRLTIYINLVHHLKCHTVVL